MTFRRLFRILHAVTALVLMVLFFATAAAFGLALITGGGSFGYGLLSHMRVSRGMILICLISLGLIISGVIILWSLVPRIDKFVPPGPELLPGEHPELFKEIHRTAARAGEAAPKHVYLVPEVNAFVTQRGGVMGFGSNRVMGIGLPLLHVLSVSELRAVLAHEFGHFAGGDTKLGTWVGKTRIAIARTLNNFAGAAEASQEVGSLALVFVVVHWPFKIFFNFYMRFTQALSRTQEYDADALAVRLEGPDAMTSALGKVEYANVAYNAYFDNELAPILTRGLVPPLGNGFAQYLKVEKVDSAIKSALNDPSNRSDPDPFDSHPPHDQRIAAISKLAAVRVASSDSRLGIELVNANHVRALEHQMSARWSPTEAPLEQVDWEHSHRALVVNWRRVAQEWGKYLGSEMTFASLDPSVAGAREVLAKNADLDVRGVPAEEVVRWASQTYLCFMLLALEKAGFTPSNRPGMPLTATRGDETIEPAPMLVAWLKGETAPETWRAQVTSLGIAEVRLICLAV